MPEGLIEKKFVDEINSYSNEELLMKYSELRAITVGNISVQGSLIFTTFLAFLAGIYKLFSDFVQRGDIIALDEDKKATLVSGFFFFIGSSVVLVLILLLLYMRSTRGRKAKFFYVEMIMKQRRLFEQVEVGQYNKNS